MGYVWKFGYEIKSDGGKGRILWGFVGFRRFCGGENVVRSWWNAWKMWCFDSHFFWCLKIRQVFEVYFLGSDLRMIDRESGVCEDAVDPLGRGWGRGLGDGD